MIRAFEEAGVPVDSYGIGSSLFSGRFDFTADIVFVNGTPQSKAGRRAIANPRLELVEWSTSFLVRDPKFPAHATLCHENSAARICLYCGYFRSTFFAAGRAGGARGAPARGRGK